MMEHFHNYELVLDELSRLDLSEYPADRVRDLFSRLGKCAFVVKTVHPGSFLIRARPRVSTEAIFTSKPQLSYKPQRFNTTYQRASTPDRTMFYGTMLPENLKPHELPTARVAALTEVSEIMRKNYFLGSERIVFSRWDVIGDIRLLMLPPLPDEKESSLAEIYQHFKERLDQNGDELLRLRTEAVSFFLAREFAKENIRADYDYLISALFTELVLDRFGLDGVFYPSVRSQRLGYNVAISPEAADTRLRLVAAGESLFEKRGLGMRLSNLSVATGIQDGSDTFSYRPWTPEDAQPRL